MTTQTQQLLVLSYNTCDQAMRGKPYGSAKPLGAACTSKTDATPCAHNMADYLERVPAAVNAAHATHFENFDLVGFQESSRWHRILAHDATLGANSLQKLVGLAHDDVKAASMISFYNPSTFTAPSHVIRSQCAEAFDGHPTGRPIQIIVFDEGVIFINVHNAHGWNFQRLQERLEAIFADQLTATQRTALQSHRIVMTGDFNEAGIPAPGVPLTWTPLGSNFATVSLVDPPVTCNRADGDWTQHQRSGEANRPGDYIFDSAALVHPEVPPHCPQKLMSDHLPVVAVIG